MWPRLSRWRWRLLGKLDFLQILVDLTLIRRILVPPLLVLMLILRRRRHREAGGPAREVAGVRRSCWVLLWRRVLWGRRWWRLRRWHGGLDWHGPVHLTVVGRVGIGGIGLCRRSQGVTVLPLRRSIGMHSDDKLTDKICFWRFWNLSIPKFLTNDNKNRKVLCQFPKAYLDLTKVPGYRRKDWWARLPNDNKSFSIKCSKFFTNLKTLYKNTSLTNAFVNIGWFLLFKYC